MWQGRIARARKLREEWEKKYDVDKCAKFYLGEQHEAEDIESTTINYFLATIKTERPNLFLHRPKMFVRPRSGRESPADERQAAIAEGVLESIAEQDDNLERSGNLAVLQNFFRMGTLKVVYDPRMEPNPQRGESIPVKDAMGKTLMDPATQLPMVDPETGQPMWSDLVNAGPGIVGGYTGARPTPVGLGVNQAFRGWY